MDYQPDSIHAAEMSRPAPPWLEQPPLPPHVAETMAGRVNHGIHSKNGAAPELPNSISQKHRPRRHGSAQRRQRRAERVIGNGLTDAEQRQLVTDVVTAGQGAQGPGIRQLRRDDLHEQRDGAAGPLADGAMSHGVQPSVPGLVDEASWVSREGWQSCLLSLSGAKCF